MTNAKQLPHTSEEWKGYTLDEIRYVRAYTAARIEINRERLLTKARNIQKNGLKTSASKGMMGKLLGAFGYIDIALMAWRVGSKMFKFTRSFRGR